MTRATTTFVGGRVFDGARLHTVKAAQFRDGVFDGLVSETDIPSDRTVCDLGGDILSPGYVDLQVNGGGGIMLNDAPTVRTLARIAAAHRSLGATAILPTLITDTPQKTAATLEAVRLAVREGLAGIAGLHLEGPHLSVARKGAHDAALIRPMDDADLQQLLAAKADIPILKVTLAPESVSQDQVRTLVRAGILVSLGHTDADFDTCRAYAKAGASCVTHLFNAMSQLGNRAPGLVGAALELGDVFAGVIADGIHVHPASLRAAWASKRGPGQLFLVSDSMAVAGTSETEFSLDGRRITRQHGQLTLENGTLAGADLDLTTAIRVLVNDVGVDLETAMRAATTVPARLVGLDGGLVVGKTKLSDINRITGTLSGLRSLEPVREHIHSTNP